MKPRMSFRVNGARVGDPARPVEPPSGTSVQATHRLPVRRAIAPLRVNAAVLVRDYRDDDGGGEVA